MRRSRHTRHGITPAIGRPPKIDHDKILDAVLDIGFAHVTVPLVAERLGVTPATVYRHVPHRAAMLADAWDRVVAELTWPALDGGWATVLTNYARTLWLALETHSGVVSALSTGLMPPRTIGMLIDLTIYLHHQGFTMGDANLLVDTIIDLVVDHRLGIERLDGFSTEPNVTRQQMAASWTPLPGDDPDTANAKLAMRDAIMAPPYSWLERKLALVIDGATQLLAN